MLKIEELELMEKEPEEVEFVIVEMYTLNIYGFLREGESHESGIARAEKYYKESLENVQSHLINHGGEYWEERVKEYEKIIKVGCKIMTYNEFCEIERKKLLSDELKEISEDKYNDAFEVLLPLAWCTIKGVEMFCMREMYTSTYTTQYARYNGKYYSKMVDCTDKTTWIYNLLVKE